jgi:hypothetical protein
MAWLRHTIFASLIRRGILRRLFTLLGGVVAGIMSGEAADDRAFDAAFGIGGDGRRDEGQRERNA